MPPTKRRNRRRAARQRSKSQEKNTLAVLYARFSPQRQRADVNKSETITTQLDRCEGYCAIHGYEVVGRFHDEYASGGDSDREGLQKAIDLACRKKAVLVVYSLWRLARDPVSAIEISERLSAAGADLAMLDINIDTRSPFGRCFYTVMAAIGELYRRQGADATSDAMLRLQDDGWLMGSVPPMGKKRGPDYVELVDGQEIRRATLVDCEEERAAIRKIVELRQGERMPYRTIARWLNDEGIDCRGGRWNHVTVRNICLDAGLAGIKSARGKRA